MLTAGTRRPEARGREGDSGRQGEGAGFWIGEGVRGVSFREALGESSGRLCC